MPSTAPREPTKTTQGSAWFVPFITAAAAFTTRNKARSVRMVVRHQFGAGARRLPVNTRQNRRPEMLTSDEAKQSTPVSWAKLLGYASDPYERKARLYPALLTLVPVLGIGGALYGLDRDVAQSLVAITTALGGAYLLVNVGRE